MENRFIYRFQKIIKIKVKGKNIKRFIERMIINKIEIFELKNINYNTITVKIYESDYVRINEFKTIYEIEIINSYGLLKYKEVLKKNLIFFIMILIGMGLLYTVSHITFKIEVIHTNKELRELILEELNNNGLRIGTFTKSYQELQNIKEKIITKHKDTIEWLEIERVGTKYVIRLEQRIIPNNTNNQEKQHVVASKYAIIKKVVASSGQIIRNTNDYVKPGDIVISGSIDLNGNIKDTVRAEGRVYGEVWYETSIEYPLTYYEEHLTGKEAKVLSIKLFNKNFEIFGKFKNKYHDEYKLISHSLIPLQIVIDHQREYETIEEIVTYEQAIDRATTLARNKILASLDPEEKIISEKQLKVTLKDSKIIVDIFFTVYENITMYLPIKEQVGE